jgi:hypothetical protein
MLKEVYQYSPYQASTPRCGICGAWHGLQKCLSFSGQQQLTAALTRAWEAMLVFSARLPMISSSIDPAFGWMIWVLSVLLPTMSTTTELEAKAVDTSIIRINAMVIFLKINPFQSTNQLNGMGGVEVRLAQPPSFRAPHHNLSPDRLFKG